MTDPKMERAEKMARDGKDIVEISRELGVEWSEVSDYVRSVHARSWRGAKKLITHRLKRLTKEKDQSTREQLADEAARWINYLYYEGKRMSRQVERARKELDG